MVMGVVLSHLFQCVCVGVNPEVSMLFGVSPGCVMGVDLVRLLH